MKEFRCLAFTDANFSVTTRTEAIRKATEYLTAKIATSTVTPYTRYVWRALDGSGFTMRINNSPTSAGYAPKMVQQWNAARDI